MWTKLKNKAMAYLSTTTGHIMLFTVLILVPWFVGWVRNAEYGSSYNLSELRDMYAWVGTQLSALHLINSKWNSPQDKQPAVIDETDIK